MLTVENISYRIGKKEILHKVDFMAKAGEMIGVLGSNGAGKSSLLKLITKENTLSDGSIYWKNRKVEDYNVKEMALERAILTQQTHISNDFPVPEVVMMGRYVHFKSLPQLVDYNAVEQAMLQTKIAKFSDRQYQTLSGGEQQRVQLARTLAQIDEGNVQGSKLFLLDEPLNNLDIKHQHQCLQLARNFARMGNVVLIVMHDINLASFYTDKIVLLNNGEMQHFGSPAEVLTEQHLRQAYDFPVSIQQHPFSKCPIAFFGQAETLN
ncbi:MAG: iron complex transport system ATP-binding protein [Arenicella sp.]|jgi:iron complex transport system ATP-binding protein